MRPLLKPGVRTAWRDTSTLQLGLDPDRAVVLTGIASADMRLIAALDGTRDLSAVLHRAQELGLDDLRARRLLGLLTEGGVLTDAAHPTGRWSDLSAAERDRLSPDLASLSLRSSGVEPGTVAFDRRRRAGVLVVGAGRVGATVVTLLAAAGVGCVAVTDEGRAVPGDAAPAGLAVSATGSRRDDAARAAARRCAPSVTTSLRRGQRPDAVVLAAANLLAPETADAWLRSDVPHLLATVRETTGVVGPFVLPGESSCLRCADLHRTDRDPSWPAVAAQLLDRSPAQTACDVGLATLVASITALQVLALLDGGDRPPSVGATLETALPGGITRRRPWPVHPACGCTWPRAS